MGKNAARIRFEDEYKPEAGRGNNPIRYKNTESMVAEVYVQLRAMAALMEFSPDEVRAEADKIRKDVLKEILPVMDYGSSNHRAEEFIIGLMAVREPEEPAKSVDKNADPAPYKVKEAATQTEAPGK